jgi:hypothetical protein
MNNNKRKFFKLFGAGAVGVTLTSLASPKNMIASVISEDTNKDTSKIEIKIHPQSVKRTKKG